MISFFGQKVAQCNVKGSEKLKLFWYCQYHKRYHTSMTKRYTTKGWRIRSNTNEPLMCEKGLLNCNRSGC